MGGACFAGTALEEISFPATLTTVYHDTFEYCESLRAIYVDDRSRARMSVLRLSKRVTLGPPPGTLAGDTRVWDLRALADVVLPEGLRRVGGHWFFGCGRSR